MTKPFAVRLAAGLVVALGGLHVSRSAVRAEPVGKLARLCARLGDDDTIRPFSPALHAATERAFAERFPGSGKKPDSRMLQSQSKYRCMNGKVFVCFIGANLPCSKINTTRDNPGADAYCHENPEADVVPAFATGHDTAYSYRCRDGRARVERTMLSLDARGFAEIYWMELPAR